MASHTTGQLASVADAFELGRWIAGSLFDGPGGPPGGDATAESAQPTRPSCLAVDDVRR
jgi:hypothetical protein